MPIIIILALIFVSLFSGWIVINFSLPVLLAGILGIISAFFAFFSIKSSLIFLIFSMLLSPEIGAGAISGRNVVIRYDDIFLIMVFFAWLARIAIFKKESSLAYSPVTKPLLFYTLVYVIATSFGILRGDIEYKKALFYVLKYIEYYIIYFMTLNVLKDEKDFSKYLKYGWIVLTMVIIYSYYYYFNAVGHDVRASAPFEAPLDSPKESEPASLGGYYIIAYSMLLALSAYSQGKMFLISVITMAFMYNSFLYTFSRASYLGLIVSFTTFIFLSSRKRIFFISAALLGIIFTLTLPGTSEKVENRIKGTFSGDEAIKTVVTPFGEIKLEESAWLRYKSLSNVINNVLPIHPALGMGVTGIGLGDNQYALVMGETGLIGLAVFIWLMYSLFKVFYLVYKNSTNDTDKIIGLGLLCALPGLLIQGVGVNTFIIVRIMEPFWFLTALASLAYLRIEGANEYGRN